MKLRNKKAYISALLSLGLLNNYAIYSTIAYANQIEKAVLNEELLKSIAVATESFNKYKSTNNLDDLEKSLSDFGEIVKFIKYESEVEESADNEMYSLFLQQRDELYRIANITGKTQYILNYANYMIEGWKYNRNMTPYTRIFLKNGIVDYNEGKIASINEELKKTYDYYFFLLSSEWELPGDAPSREWFDNMNNQIPDVDVDVSGPPPEYDEGVKPEPPTDEDMGLHPDSSDEEFLEEGENESTDSYYEKEGDKCMYIQKKFKGNTMVEYTKTEAPKKDYIYCGIYDYVVEDEVFAPGEIEIDEEYIYSNQNIESNKYIYYTVNKNSLNPYYFNSGIRATLDSKVTYNQLKDVLYQIAIKMKGFTIDSNNKSLTIIEGRPILVTDEQELYSKKQVEDLLNSFEFADMKIQNYVDESKVVSNMLFDYIKENSSLDIKLNKNNFTLTGVEVNNNVIMVSLNEISEILNLQVNKTNNNYIIKGDENSIEITPDIKTYKDSNDEIKEFLFKPKEKENDVYIDFETLCKEMNYILDWDNDNLTLYIDKETKNNN